MEEALIAGGEMLLDYLISYLGDKAWDLVKDLVENTPGEEAINSLAKGEMKKIKIPLASIEKIAKKYQKWDLLKSPITPLEPPMEPINPPFDYLKPQRGFIPGNFSSEDPSFEILEFASRYHQPPPHPSSHPTWNAAIPSSTSGFYRPYRS